MASRTRRRFLADVGRGMLIAGAGYATAVELELAPVLADEAPDSLVFGPFEPLVCLMQETPAEKLLPLLVQRLRGGTSLEELMAAAALANARSFGGEDYIGFHTLMAMTPALAMAEALPVERRALPVLKVLYRNTSRLQQRGGRANEVLRPLADPVSARPATGQLLRQAVRRGDLKEAERLLAASTAYAVDDGFNSLLAAVTEGADVHRVVLAYRAWDLLDIVGREHAETLLRQSVHYCVKAEPSAARYFAGMRLLLPRLLDEYRLPAEGAKQRTADDAWIEQFSQTIFKSSPDSAATAVAAALSEGFSPDAVGEAITLATNQLLLRDVGRRGREVQQGKPAGSVHGDSIGLHACDSSNAWCNIARVCGSARNTMACLALAGYQAALDRIARGGDFFQWQPLPWAEHLEQVAAAGPEKLLGQLDAAIRDNDQQRACAIVHRYGSGGQAPQPLFDLLLGHAVSQDGALHVEKFYRTASEEFARTRPAYRWRHAVALARVVASGSGQAAPGYDQAVSLLG